MIANNVVNSLLQGATPKVKVDFQAMTVEVTIQKQYIPVFGIFRQLPCRPPPRPK